jgi:hypothetical protein
MQDLQWTGLVARKLRERDSVTALMAALQVPLSNWPRRKYSEIHQMRR